MSHDRKSDTQQPQQPRLPQQDAGTGRLPEPGAGAHEKRPDEPIRSRSADPGQSSYGGFSGEDPRRQAQDLQEGEGARADKEDKNGKTGSA